MIRKNRQQAKAILTFFIAAQMLLGYFNLAYAQTQPINYSNAHVSDQIKTYLCAPSDSSNATTGNTDLFTCINRLYRVAIAIAGSIGILFIVISGYLYMSAEGNQESVDKAKSIFTSTIAAMVILMSGYVLLKALNPDLLHFQSVQPPSITATSISCPSGSTLNALQQCVTASGTIISPSTPPGAACVPLTSGAASVANLQSACFGSNATQASSIANLESGGDVFAQSGTDKCMEDGNSVSWGLFQINLTDHSLPNPNGSGQMLDCSNAFNLPYGPYTASNHHCSVRDQTLFNLCKQAATTASINISVACQISQNGTHWSQWGANSKCNFPR